MSTFFTVYGDPISFLLRLPEWQSHLIIGVLLAYKMGLAGFILARAGFTPLLALLLLVPYVDLIALWLFAYRRWPSQAQGRADEGRGPT